jgi:hypothetical protein
MIMLIVAVVLVGVSAYVWCLRGFFSGLIHLACVLAAGAVAFGVYEPLGYMLLSSSPDRGAMSFTAGVVWALSLALPFALTLAVLRLSIDKILPANAQCETAVDYVGGGLCGLASGVIAAGICVHSLGYLELPSTFGGYSSVSFTSGTGRGSIEANTETMVPWVDRITTGIYSRLSLTTMRTDEPLAKWHPDLVTESGASRLTYEDSSRNTIKADAFKLLGWYTVGSPTQPTKIDGLLADTWNETPQKATDLHGEAFEKGYVAGFIVQFNSKAREKTGQVIVGNGQIRLIVQSLDEDDDTKAIHPVAVITNIDDPSRIDYARFRYDGDGVYFASVGGSAESTMSFEFPIPDRYHPIALYVKGTRIEIEAMPDKVPNYESPGLRDEWVHSGNVPGMGGIGPVLDENGKPVPAPQQGFQNMTPPIIISNAIGVTIQKGTEQSLEVQQNESGRGWSVVNGDQRLKNEVLRGFGGVDANLRIDRFATTPDTVVVKVTMTLAERSDDFVKALDTADKSKPIVLVDNNGTKYEPVGFIYRDSGETWIRYTKGDPIHSVQALPPLSRSAPDKHLTLLYSVSFGVQILELRIGDTLIEDYRAMNPPIKAEVRQK